jgi:putative transposase
MDSVNATYRCEDPISTSAAIYTHNYHRGIHRHVSRLRRIAQSDRIFFITTNLRTSVADFSPRERDCVLSAIDACRNRAPFGLFGYVVMPNHMHLLISPRAETIFATMSRIKRATQLQIHLARERSVPIWQARYFDSVIRRVRAFWEKLEYIHQNPVAAGLSARPEDWKWSSYAAYHKTGVPPIEADGIELPADGDFRLW